MSVKISAVVVLHRAAQAATDEEGKGSGSVFWR